LRSSWTTCEREPEAASSTDRRVRRTPVWRKTLTPSESTSLALVMAAVSSPACFWRLAHSVAFIVQLCLSSSRYFVSAARSCWVSEREVSATWSSSSVVERVSVASPSCFFATAMPSSRPCLSSAKACAASISSLRVELRDSSAFACMSSRVSRMPLDCDAYAFTVAWGWSERSSSLSSVPCWRKDWSTAFWCAFTQLASTIFESEAVIAPMAFRTRPVCMRLMFFLSVIIARSRESTVSESSFSDERKTSCSVSRISVALARSFSSPEIFVVSSSIEVVNDIMVALASSIVAIRSPIVRFELVIASSFSLASSSHQDVYSSISFSS
jgi:hypothetical protein